MKLVTLGEAFFAQRLGQLQKNFKISLRKLIYNCPVNHAVTGTNFDILQFQVMYRGKGEAHVAAVSSVGRYLHLSLDSHPLVHRRLCRNK